MIKGLNNGTSYSVVIAAINALVGPAGSSATDSAVELQAIADAVNKLRTAANTKTGAIKRLATTGWTEHSHSFFNDYE